MKFTILVSFIVIFASFGFSQDLITKTNGDQIEGKVVEITSSTIKYKRKDQPDGPIRNISLTEVQLITYADGTKERFVQVESETKKEPEPRPEVTRREPRYTPRRGLDRIKADKDRILEPGMFIDLLIGYANYGDHSYMSDHFGGVNIKLGNKWYFGKGEKYRPGIQATWIRAGVFSDTPSPGDISKGYFSVLNLGFANAIKFKEKRGMEVNLNVGPTILEPPLPGNDSGEFGLLYGLEVKYRLGRLALGFDATRVEEQLGYGYGVGNGDALTLLSFSVGFKF